MCTKDVTKFIGPLMKTIQLQYTLCIMVLIIIILYNNMYHMKVYTFII